MYYKEEVKGGYPEMNKIEAPNCETIKLISEKKINSKMIEKIFFLYKLFCYRFSSTEYFVLTKPILIYSVFD